MKTSALFAVLPMFLACAAAAPPTTDHPIPGGPPPPAGSSPAPAPAPTPACEPLAPRTTPLEVFVQPDSGPTPFVDTLNKAKTSIRVMVYEMGFGPILDALVAKAKAGVKTRIILDV